MRRGRSVCAEFMCISRAEIKTCTSVVVALPSLSHAQLFATPWTIAHQAPLSSIISWSLLKLMSIESMMPYNHYILCHPLLLFPSIFPSVRVFSNESTFHIRWPKYWSFSFSVSPSSEHSGLIPFRTDCEGNHIWPGFLEKKKIKALSSEVSGNFFG